MRRGATGVQRRYSWSGENQPDDGTRGQHERTRAQKAKKEKRTKKKKRTRANANASLHPEGRERHDRHGTARHRHRYGMAWRGVAWPPADSHRRRQHKSGETLARQRSVATQPCMQAPGRGHQPAPPQLTQYWPPGCSCVRGMECMPGSLMYLMGTGTPKSHTSTFLSSLVVTYACERDERDERAWLCVVRCQSRTPMVRAPSVSRAGWLTDRGIAARGKGCTYVLQTQVCTSAQLAFVAVVPWLPRQQP